MYFRPFYRGHFNPTYNVVMSWWFELAPLVSFVFLRGAELWSVWFQSFFIRGIPETIQTPILWPGGWDVLTINLGPTLYRRVWILGEPKTFSWEFCILYICFFPEHLYVNILFCFAAKNNRSYMVGKQHVCIWLGSITKVLVTGQLSVWLPKC